MHSISNAAKRQAPLVGEVKRDGVYYNRAGQEVAIKGVDVAQLKGEPLYKGDNGHWYQATGAVWGFGAGPKVNDLVAWSSWTSGHPSPNPRFVAVDNQGVAITAFYKKRSDLESVVRTPTYTRYYPGLKIVEYREVESWPVVPPPQWKAIKDIVPAGFNPAVDKLVVKAKYAGPFTITGYDHANKEWLAVGKDQSTMWRLENDEQYQLVEHTVGGAGR